MMGLDWKKKECVDYLEIVLKLRQPMKEVSYDALTVWTEHNFVFVVAVGDVSRWWLGDVGRERFKI